MIDKIGVRYEKVVNGVYRTGIMFLNRHWILKETGFIRTKPSHRTLSRLKKRYKKIKEKVSADALERYSASINSFLKFFNNRRIVNYVYN